MAPIIPKDCQPPLYRCNRATAERYISYSPDGSYTIGLPVQPSQIDPQHIIFTMGCKQKPHKTAQSGLMYALVDKLSEAAREEILFLALGGSKNINTRNTTTPSSAAMSTSSIDSGCTKTSVNEQQIDSTSNTSIRTGINSSSEIMELTFFKYCSLPIDRNPADDDIDKGHATTASLVAFDILLKVGIAVVLFAVFMSLYTVSSSLDTIPLLAW